MKIILNNTVKIILNKTVKIILYNTVNISLNNTINIKLLRDNIIQHRQLLNADGNLILKLSLKKINT